MLIRAPLSLAFTPSNMRHGLTDYQTVFNDWDIAGDATYLGVTDAEHANYFGRSLHFMAIELNWRPHDNIPRHYRQDLEALLWVLALVFLAYRSACETDVKPHLSCQSSIIRTARKFSHNAQVKNITKNPPAAKLLEST